MPELPWEKWYAQDWYGEPSLSLCDAASRGIWADAVNVMILKQTDRISGNIEQLSRLCRCRTTQMQTAISEFKQFGVCDIEQKGDSITLANRRRVRQKNISNLRRNAAYKALANRWQTPPQQGIAKCVSASVSSGSTGGGAGGGNGAEIPTLAECREYATNPACGFPPELVEEWYNKSADRGWGQDWQARMRGAVATYRSIAFERRSKGHTEAGVDPDLAEKRKNEALVFGGKKHAKGH